MRPFITWPRWALVALVAVLVRTGLLPRMLTDAERELFTRDVVEWDYETEGAWRCAPIRGVQ